MHLILKGKKMTLKLKKVLNRIAAFMLVVLGFSSCGNDGDDPIPDEYGTPFATYQLKGKITDQDGKPLNGIQVQLCLSGVKDNPISPLNTDEDGNYVYKPLLYYSSYGDIKIKITDVDGQANGGEFNTDSVMPTEMQLKQTKEGDGWDAGTYDVIADKKLTKKK